MREKVILAVGNVEGVAAVEDDVTGGEGEPTFHTVEKGDTLWAISEKTLGNGAHYEKIFEANKPMLSHPDKIYPGQMLRIPTLSNLSCTPDDYSGCGPFRRQRTLPIVPLQN
jgi:nucleoid-associated protein YgaU